MSGVNIKEKMMTQHDLAMWFSRGMDDALVDQPDLYPTREDPIAAHLSYIDGRKFVLNDTPKEIAA